MSFVPQNALESALMKAATDPACRPKFYRELVAAELFVIEEGPPEAAVQGRKTISSGEYVSLRKLEWQGRPCLPVFSSLPRLKDAIREEVCYLSMNSVSLMEITRGEVLLLNPGSDFGKELSVEEIASVLDGSIWDPTQRYEVEHETRVLIGQPSRYPQQLVDALSRFFQTQNAVKRAYLAQFFNPAADEKPHTLIAVECSGDCDRVMAEAGIVSNNVEVLEPPVDFILITGKGGIEDYFLKECKPFYRRKWFGLI